MTWHVWTDGSCHHGLKEAPRGVGGWGGWCAIIENGSDGRVVRGRVPNTTNVRMELRAAIEGLRVVADGSTAVLHTDCTTVTIAIDHWQRGLRPTGKDAKLWRQLGQQLERVPVTAILIVRGNRDPVHRRCHVIAGAEARGGLRSLPANSVPLDELGGAHTIRKGMRRLAVRQVPNVTCDWCGSVGGHRTWCALFQPYPA